MSVTLAKMLPDICCRHVHLFTTVKPHQTRPIELSVTGPAQDGQAHWHRYFIHCLIWAEDDCSTCEGLPVYALSLSSSIYNSTTMQTKSRIATSNFHTCTCLERWSHHTQISHLYNHVSLAQPEIDILNLSVITMVNEICVSFNWICTIGAGIMIHWPIFHYVTHKL